MTSKKEHHPIKNKGKILKSDLWKAYFGFSGAWFRQDVIKNPACMVSKHASIPVHCVLVILKSIYRLQNNHQQMPDQYVNPTNQLTYSISQ